MSQKLLLKWNNHMNVMNEFKHFLSSETMIDVTIACDGQSLKAHKIVLSACSSFFKSLFLENPCKHPIVILKDVKYSELKAIIDFMYCGEVSVEANQVTSLVKVAQSLKVNGLGEVEPQNEPFSYESLDESENQSDNESITESVLTLDVLHNESFEEQSMIDQDVNEDSKSEVAILETPEIKEEEIVSEYNNHGVSCSGASTMPFQCNRINSFKSKKDMPIVKGQTLVTDSLTRQSHQSSVESNMELHQNHSDSMPSLVLATSTHVSSGQPSHSSVLSNTDKHQNHSDNMPNLVISTHPSSGLSFKSSAQTSMKLNKNHSNDRPSLSITPTRLLLGQSFQPPALLNNGLPQKPSSNMCDLPSVTSTQVSQKQSFLSSAQSSKMELKKNHSDKCDLPSITSTRVSQGQSFLSSKMELNKNHSDNMCGLPSVTSTQASQRQSFLSSTLSSKTKLNKNHSDNMPGPHRLTSTHETRGQLSKSSAQSNSELYQNRSDNIVHSLISTHISQGQSAKSNKEMPENHKDNIHDLFSVTSTQGSHPNIELNKNHSDNMCGLPPVTSTRVSQRQSFSSSVLSSKTELNKNHSGNVPGPRRVTSTHVTQGQLSKSSAKSNREQYQNRSDNMACPFILRVLQKQSAKSNKELHENHRNNMHGLPSVISTQGSHSNMELNQNHSDNMLSSVSVTNTCVSLNATAIHSQQPSTFPASGKSPKKKMKLPSKVSVYALKKRKMGETEVYQLPSLRKPEVLIINECNSKKNCNKKKDSKRTKNIRKCRRKKISYVE